MACDSEQRVFLREDLAASTEATWRIVYHYPPYVSGDYEVPQMRALGPDLESGGVDLVFNSHTIVYERSHPIRDGRLDVADGIPYIIAGGAGAKPDWFHPKRAWHTAQAQAVPHFVHVSIAGPTLELQAVDMDGRVRLAASEEVVTLKDRRRPRQLIASRCVSEILVDHLVWSIVDIAVKFTFRRPHGRRSLTRSHVPPSSSGRAQCKWRPADTCRTGAGPGEHHAQ